jgi:hypothetical protein
MTPRLVRPQGCTICLSMHAKGRFNPKQNPGLLPRAAGESMRGVSRAYWSSLRKVG